MTPLENLNQYTIYLASKSPRRREILEMLRLPFKIITLEGLDESYPSDLPPHDVPLFISEKKAQAYLSRLSDDALIITADTLVLCDGKIIGKPKDSEDAKRILKFLSGKTHEVATGVTISSKNKKKSFVSVSEVTFAPLSEDEIDYYVHTYHPFDKAGAYGIQEWIGAVAVSSFKGSFYNVMGLPVHSLYQELKNF